MFISGVETVKDTVSGVTGAACTEAEMHKMQNSTFFQVKRGSLDKPVQPKKISAVYWSDSGTFSDQFSSTVSGLILLSAISAQKTLSDFLGCSRRTQK